MRFEVIRTSGGEPCEGATREDTEYKIGDVPYKERVWVIEINSLDDLLAFSEKQGYSVIVRTKEYNSSKYPRIEVYDGYRE